MERTPIFSTSTLAFLKKASRQKHPTWLDRNREEYERVLLQPLFHLARTLKSELSPFVLDYRFPQKGIGRLKRSRASVAEHGGGLYRNWITYSASRPRESRFEHNPNIFFLINQDDPKDPVLLAGGLYMPSSRQLRCLRETVAKDASPFEKLFATSGFKKSFPGCFSDEKISSRVPRGFDPNHPRLHWIRLQAFFVWKPYSMREFTSPHFAELVARDGRQILRMNSLIQKALDGQLEAHTQFVTKNTSGLLDRIHEMRELQKNADWE